MMTDRERRAELAYFKETMLSFLKDGVWYDGTVKPPSYFGHQFLLSHDHYHAWKADGMLPRHLLDGSIRGIREHGSDENMILLCNEGSVDINALPTLLPWESHWAVPQIVAKVSNYGVRPKYIYPYHTAVCIVDWMPENYALLLADIPDSLAMVRRGAGVALCLDAASYQEPATDEHRFGLRLVDIGSRRFRFADPVEVVSKNDDAGNLVSLECLELQIVASSPAEFAAFVAADYDGLVGEDDDGLTADAQEKKRWLIANVTEEARTQGLPKNDWGFSYAWSEASERNPKPRRSNDGRY